MRRIGWADLPAHVRAAVEEILGDRVVAAASQSGGYSPGTADRVRTAGGRRAFVKAVSPALNDRSPVRVGREPGPDVSTRQVRRYGNSNADGADLIARGR